MELLAVYNPLAADPLLLRFTDGPDVTVDSARGLTGVLWTSIAHLTVHPVGNRLLRETRAQDYMKELQAYLAGVEPPLGPSVAPPLEAFTRLADALPAAVQPDAFRKACGEVEFHKRVEYAAYVSASSYPEFKPLGALAKDLSHRLDEPGRYDSRVVEILWRPNVLDSAESLEAYAREKAGDPLLQKLADEFAACAVGAQNNPREAVGMWLALLGPRVSILRTRVARMPTSRVLPALLNDLGDQLWPCAGQVPQENFGKWFARLFLTFHWLEAEDSEHLRLYLTPEQMVDIPA